MTTQECLEGVFDSGGFKKILITYRMLEHLPVLVVKFNSGYRFFIGVDMPVSKEMLLQYIPNGLADNNGYAGAFGKNPSVLKIIEDGLLK